MQNYSQMKNAKKMTNNIIFKQMVLLWAHGIKSHAIFVNVEFDTR